MIRWVFLDVGNILLDEDPIAYHCTRLHWEAVQRIRPEVTFLDLIAAREARSLGGSRWPLYDAVSSWIDELDCAEAWNRAEQDIRSRYAELSPLIAGARELVDRLSARFQLGIIANQGAECRAWLDALGLLSQFQVVSLSEEVQRFKPDPNLYLHALEAAGEAADRCVMIGDRLDNDIEPARSLGMAAAWVRWPDRKRKGWQPVDPAAIAFQASLQRSAARALDQYRGTTPSLVVDDLFEIDEEDLAQL